MENKNNVAKFSEYVLAYKNVFIKSIEGMHNPESFRLIMSSFFASFDLISGMLLNGFKAVSDKTNENDFELKCREIYTKLCITLINKIAKEHDLNLLAMAAREGEKEG